MKTSCSAIPGRVFLATVGSSSNDLRAADAALPTDIAEHLARVLASPQFARARRDGPLLRYLVCASLGPGMGPVSEYVIGIELYRRDPATYAPGEDPIVRVQMMRLRARLARYYREEGKSDTLRLAIPARGYTVVLEYAGTTAMQYPAAAMEEHSLVGETAARGIRCVYGSLERL